MRINVLLVTLYTIKSGEPLVEVVETGESLEGEVHLESNYAKCYYFTAVKLGDGCSITIRDLTDLKQSALKSIMEQNQRRVIK